MNPAYRAQVDLLIRMLPIVAEQSCFALKGGTAINLFVSDLPRLSVDIDLTYLPVVDRTHDFTGIAFALQSIRERLEVLLPGIVVNTPKSDQATEAKLICRWNGVTVKIEVNTVIRGQLWPTRRLELSPKTQTEFGKYAAIEVVSEAELFGGKICAALDRQHPRDLFDVRGLLNRSGITDEVRHGFIAMLLSHGRPLHELLNPQRQEMRTVLETQFAGMTIEPFSYEQYAATREELIQSLREGLTNSERTFLISFKAGEPQWELFPLAALSTLPAVQWKLFNILKLRKSQPIKHAEQLLKLQTLLGQ